MNRYKIAIVHDWITSISGSEKCLIELLKVFPGADLFTIIYNPKGPGVKSSLLSKRRIHTSFVNSLPFSSKLYRYYLLLFPFAVESFNLSKYDLIISSSFGYSHGVITTSNQLHICYMNTPNRFIWSGHSEYKNNRYKSRRNTIFANLYSQYLRLWDYSASKRPDKIIALSQQVQNRISKYYKIHSEVIYPPVKTSYDLTFPTKEKYYLTISRLVPNKNIDLTIKCFNRFFRDRKLIIAGSGPEEKYLKKLASSNPNIIFKGYVNESYKISLLSKAKAFIFAPNEDFGITPVEALACGTPVIAYKKGGALETIQTNITGVFFSELTITSHKEAIDKFDSIKFDTKRLVEHARRFDESFFRKKILTYINNELKVFFNKS